MNCPECGSNGQGKLIPEAQRYLDGPTHYSRFLGVEYGYGHPERYDGVSEWRCPDCKCRWGRWSGNILEEGEWEPRAAMNRGYVNAINGPGQFRTHPSVLLHD